MTDIDIVNFIARIEERYPVNNWVIHNRHVWPLVKMMICSALPSENDGGQPLVRSRVNKMMMKLGHYKNVLSRFYLDKEEADVMIFHHNIARHLSLDDSSMFDVNLDPFTIMFEGRYHICSLEYMAGNNHNNFFRSSTVVDGAIQRVMLRSKFIRDVDNKKVLLSGYEHFLDECGPRLEKALSVISIYRTITYMNSIASFFAKIIRKKKIKLVIAGCGYGTDTAALFMACKDAGVKCMEVQHGLAAGNGHRWYSSWTKMPQDGTRYEMLPDIYWCWSHEDEAVLNSWSGGLHTVYAGGKPIYSVMNELKKLTIGSSFTPKKQLPNILFTLQPNVNYPEWLVEVIKDTCNQYNWIIRKHPRFDNCQANLIDRISNIPNVYIDGISSIMLEKLLMCADVHITNHSAVAIDALEFNVKSIILSKKHIDCFSEQIKHRDVYVGHNRSNFTKLLKNILVQREENNIFEYNSRKTAALKFLDMQLK